MVELWRTHRKY